MLMLLDYNHLARVIGGGRTLEQHYTKTDGTRIFLRICRVKEFEAGKKEAFWIFEKYSNYASAYTESRQSTAVEQTASLQHQGLSSTIVPPSWSPV